MRIAHVTDIHIQPPGWLAFRRYDTEAGWREAVVAINRQRPDLVLITGDLVEQGSTDEYARFRAICDRLHAPVLAIPGNHDTRPGIKAAFADKVWMDQAGPFAQFAMRFGDLHVIGLDSTIPGRGAGELCADRLDWLEARLAETPEVPTLVLAHHPPFACNIAEMDRTPFVGRERLAEILRRHPQVQRLLCGHVHRAIQAVFGGTLAIAAPSPTYAFALDLHPSAPLAYTREPPGFYLHILDGGATTSHLVPIGDFDGPHPFLKDGKRVRTHG